MTTKTNINWNYPEPRPGIAGAWDKFFGPGTTKAEAIIQWAFCITAAIAMILYAQFNELTWSTFQLVLATLLAFDVVGGVLTNACSSAKRWYHRPGLDFKTHYGFIAMHVIHIFLVAAFFRSMDWGFLGIVSGYLLLTAFIVLKTPLYLQRPVALGMVLIAILLNTYAFSPIPGLEWFLPFLFIKLIVSHALHEEPYRPETEVV